MNARLLLALSVSLAAAASRGGEVKCVRAPMPLKTYPAGEPEKNPMFFEKRVYQGSCGKVYPVPFIDKVSDDPVVREYDAVTLENDFTRVVLLPELGGRIYIGQDKTNNDYDFFYRNDVIKPALVGLAGPWLSGGVEFNWPQHHRPATFMPVEVSVERGDDGSVTAWMTDHDPLNRLEGAHGICLRPGSSVVELKARLYNRTPFTQTFLWWANVAARVHEKYESFFPADVTYVADHAVRASTSFPRSNGLYYGVDYSKRPGADSLAWYKNIPVPTSYMVCATDYDFFGGYDHAAHGGFVHVADRHVAPGKKQWTWGNHPFGYAWDRELTDDSGPYIELMAGVYTDNQPDFSYLLPYETKTFSQYWWPYKDLGPVKNANTKLAVSLGGGKAGVVASENIDGVDVLCGGDVVAEKIDLRIGHPVEFATSATRIAVRKNGETLISFDANAKAREQPINQSWAEPDSVPQRAVATEPPAPADIASADELFITAEHLDQYRHPTRMPEAYLDELLRRDPEDSRAHTLYGKRLIYRGLLKEAEEHLVRAVKRQTLRHPNPYTGEALYYLGLARQYQGKLDAAYPCFYKATWNGEFRSAGYYRLATIDAQRGDWEKAKEHAAESLMTDARNEKAKMLLDIGRKEHKDSAPLRLCARKPVNPDMALDAAYDLVEMGMKEKAVGLLKKAPANTLSKYVLAYIAQDRSLLAEAAKSSPDYFFPSRLEDYLALKWCDEAASFKDANVAYALGNWLYDRKRHEDALACWERATRLAPAFPTAWRNLGVALWNVRRDGKGAQAAYAAAIKADPKDARLVAEYDQLREKCKVTSAERLKFLEKHLPLVLSRDDSTVQYVTCLNDLGRQKEALKVLASRRFHPWEGGEGKVLAQYTRAHLELGRAALAAGDYAAALDHAGKAFDTPHNLGEAYHLLQAKADVNYLRGMALRGLGRTQESRDALLAAAEEAGDFQAMAVTEYSELSYWRGLAIKELGRTDDARALFAGMKAFAEKGLKTPFKIDYFATSLPLLLIFEDDLEAVKNERMENLKSLAEKGMEGMPK
ncbi:MAG: DUF5107 domain-containing protein [Kiritimatiellae bacterium]|nr:DUF5107 domain-containing protein [Kiritimatiellia bacterium]